jgi:hypothetical protein
MLCQAAHWLDNCTSYAKELIGERDRQGWD